MTERHAHARVARVVAMFESITPADVARLGEFYTPDARFKDPFNEVQGVPAIHTSQVPAELIVFRGKADFAPIVGVALVVGAIFISVNLIVDLLYGVLNPKVRTR